MVLLGIPGAISVAIVNLVGSYIPYIGAFVGGGLAVLLALAHGGTSQALIMLAVVLLVQNTLENVIQPKITAKYVSLSPLAVLLATALGGVIASIVGLVLAVPLAAIGKEAVRISRRADGVSTSEAPVSTADDTS
jgi:predicted PurR-regulated permease PerM